MAQLGINPALDKLARENGLGHWSCTDPKGFLTWLRSDGVVRMGGDKVANTFNVLKVCDKHHGIGEDWQKPKYDLIERRRVILGKFELTEEDRTEVKAIEEKLKTMFDDFGFSRMETPSDIEFKSIIERAANALKNHPALVQKPFQYPCDGALYFTQKDRKQVFISGIVTSDLPMIIVGKHSDMVACEFGFWHTDGGKAMIYDGNQYTCVGANNDIDLIMFVWE